MHASGDSCYSLYDLDQVYFAPIVTCLLSRQFYNNFNSHRQESNMGKSSDDVNFTMCFEDSKDEIERLHHTINEMESENGCYRLLITRLEDELLMIRKSETRAVSHIHDDHFTRLLTLASFRNKIEILKQISCAFSATK
jgi:hypothetical protein